MDKAALLKLRLPEDVVDVPGVGAVRVRGLSRADVLALQQADTSAPGGFERKLLSLAMVDPELTEDEVGQWQAGAGPMELEAVTAKVSEMSGMGKAAAKDAYKEFESDPDAEFHVLPGEGTGDDSGEADGGVV